MSLHLTGWVEFQDLLVAGESSWIPTLYLPAVVSTSEYALARLFERPQPQHKITSSPWPSDVSTFVRLRFDEDLESNEVGVPSGYVSSILWSELKQIANEPGWSEDWQLLFRLMSLLAEARGDDAVRIFFWAYVNI